MFGLVFKYSSGVRDDDSGVFGVVFGAGFGVGVGVLGAGAGFVLVELLPHEFADDHEAQLFGFFLSPSLMTCILTYGVHSSIPQIFSIDDLLKSIALLYLSKFHVSSITTSVDNHVLVLVTFTIVQNGRELCAAIFDVFLYILPLLVAFQSKLSL